MEDYIVVEALIYSSPIESKDVAMKEFSKKVTEKMADGYQPVGGVSATSAPTSYHGGYGIHLFQAMVRNS